MTLTQTADKYVVHELLRPSDEITPCEPHEVMHSSEVAGRDIHSSEDGFWTSITHGEGVFGDVFVDAGPISHRGSSSCTSAVQTNLTVRRPDPCLGFVIRESVSPFRKIVILGDTYDPSDIIPLCTDPPPSLLIHEATDAHISQDIDPKAKRPFELVREKTLARGHSMPAMAGTFARQIGAEKLVLNHIGGRLACKGVSSAEFGTDFPL